MEEEATLTAEHICWRRPCAFCALIRHQPLPFFRDALSPVDKHVAERVCRSLLRGEHQRDDMIADLEHARRSRLAHADHVAKVALPTARRVALKASHRVAQARKFLQSPPGLHLVNNRHKGG